MQLLQVRILSFSLAHRFASTYLSSLRGSASYCSTPGAVSAMEGASAMANFDWEAEKVPELSVGLSCCPWPPEDRLGAIWDRHRRSLVNLIDTAGQVSVLQCPGQ